MPLSLSAALALLLGAATPPPTDPPDATPQSMLAAEAISFKRVTVGFTKVAPLDPAKRATLRKAEFNREYWPLILQTLPDGTRVLRHGPSRQIEYRPADSEAASDAPAEPPQ